MVTCADCGADNLLQARTCRTCGSSLVRARFCPICGSSNPTGSRFCNQCGYAVAQIASAEISEPEDAATTADSLSAGEAPLALPEKGQLGRGPTSGRTSGLEPPKSGFQPLSAEKPRSAAEWTSLLGKPLVSGILIARCLSPEGPGLALATWPMTMPVVDSEQYGSQPSWLKVPKHRRVWLAQ
jgi:ribosomal protein L40E